MRIVFNPAPPKDSFSMLPVDWHKIKQPKQTQGLILSILAGLGLPLLPFGVLSLQSLLLPTVEQNQTETVPWWIIFPAVLVCVVLHELLHAAGHPGGGLSPQSLVFIWPRRLQLGVFYDGFMSRTRWLVMRLAPFIGLTILPMIVLLAVYPDQISFFWQQFIVLVIFVNCLGSGGDVVASVIVARQVPHGGELGTWNGQACWRAAQGAG